MRSLFLGFRLILEFLNCQRVIEKQGGTVRGYIEGQRVIAGATAPISTHTQRKTGAISGRLLPGAARPVRLPRLRSHGGRAVAWRLHHHRRRRQRPPPGDLEEDGCRYHAQLQDLGVMVTHHYKLENIVEAYELFSNQRDGVLKVAIKPA